MAYIELLSPAGGWDALKAAIEEGADAVYFGLGRFNARMRADNFSDSELGTVVRYCHERGVRAYLALNTLVKNSELKDYFEIIGNAYAEGIDAVIIQEISFVHLIKEKFPRMEVHVSTQAGVFNSYCGELLKDADRIILPREFTVSMLREFTNKTKIPVEVFVQGALCFCVSGQCLMSSFLGGRSANRGLCAQPCRKKYNKKYLLSTRDLCTAGRIAALADAGASSLKIEGRLRSADYTGAATAVYRRAIDSGVVDDDALMDLKLAFSREYTSGAVFKEYDVVTPDAAGKRGIYIGRVGKEGMVKLEVEVRTGDGIGIVTKKGVHGDIIREIMHNNRKADFGLKGQTVELRVNAHEGDELVLTSGVKRRKPYLIPVRQKIEVKRKPEKITLPEINTQRFSSVKLLVKTYSVKDAHSALDAGADRVYYDVFSKDYPKGEVNPYVPRCLFEWNAKKAVELIYEINPESVLCGDLGVASQLGGFEVYPDTSCNAFNDIDVSYYNRRGLIPVISPEISFRELDEFRDKRFAVYAHGRIPLMTTKYVLDEDTLTDEMNYTFPVRNESDYRQVLNSVPLGLYGSTLRLMKTGITHFLLDLDENVFETVSTYKKILNGEKIKKQEGYTLGNYREGVI